MIKLGMSLKSGIGAILRACGSELYSCQHQDFGKLPDDLPKPEKTGHPPSKCYGSEMSCHSDSW